MMALFKYIILRDLEGVERPLVFDRDLQHSHVLPEHTIAVSAGHGVLCEGRLHVPEIGSETLHLDPRPQDRVLLEQFLGLTRSAAVTPERSCCVPRQMTGLL
ncbi:MAG TPA: hypothetical protein DDZ88_25340 [Verrucomicrobiales bacterium]|nr:hypothetical protein [Verrucomicrobiales bacterium]